MLTIDIETIKKKLYEKLKPSGWASVLNTFLLGPEIDKLLQSLMEENVRGLRFTPPLKKVFAAFEACPWKMLDVIIVGHEPYPDPEIADGLAFSYSGSLPLPPALSFIHQAVKETVYPHLEDKDYVPSADLTPWANQGILLLNTALTTSVGKTNGHPHIWNEFTRFALTRISELNFAGLIFVFMGKQVEHWGDLVGENHYKFFVPHPSSGRYSADKKWNAKNIFNEVNRIREATGNSKIIW